MTARHAPPRPPRQPAKSVSEPPPVPRRTKASGATSTPPSPPPRLPLPTAPPKHRARRSQPSVPGLAESGTGTGPLPASCAQSDIHPGDLVAGRYRVNAIVNRTRGLLLDASHTAFEQHVTIRVISPTLTTEKGVDQLQREARTIAKLESDHAARIIDFGTLQDGSLYLVREHLEGVTLAERIQRRGALPLSEAVLLCLQVCEAVQEAHSHGIVLRDLATADVLVTQKRNGTPVAKLTDFGTCKVVAHHTDSGEISSTRLLDLSASASPEVARQDRSIDARADVWSLGCLLYELITGRAPFPGDGFQDDGIQDNGLRLMQSIARDDPTPPSRLRSNLPEALDAVVATALAKDPQVRLESPYAFAIALRPFATAHGQLLIEQIARLAGDYAPTAAPPAQDSGDEQSMAMVRSIGSSETGGESSIPPRPTTPPPRSLTAPAMGLPPMGPTDPRFTDNHPWTHLQPKRRRLSALPWSAVARGAMLAMPLCVVLFVLVVASPEAGPPAQTVPVAGYATDLEAPLWLVTGDIDDADDETDELAKLNTRIDTDRADRAPAAPDDFDDLAADLDATSPPQSASSRAEEPKQPKARSSVGRRSSSQFLGQLGERTRPAKPRAQRRSRRAPPITAIRF
ncbi:MAG: hypothetical protein DRI90_24475 [Deltaproteobacteria bacterium]|nr:MAG: hypothetical protein DRI90_24475 [Deltaproteobacteria bacterium]